ncbi:MAG: hypothetical protein H6745_17375 [Deltaproteobacteria bacterium]|nr:hypothetical protein [Deltaproteobacteria bacterium]
MPELPRRRGGERVIKKHGGLGSIYRCAGCGLLFRPTGLQTGPIARWYYSVIYGDGEITRSLAEDRDVAVAHARAGGKDRGALVEPLLDALPSAAQSIGVLGASWGYELLAFEDLGVPVWGIEPGDRRRAHGQRAFGLELYPTIEAARRAGRGGGVLFSSHVLEHIPTLGATLTEALTTLKPAAQLHITPRVDPLTPAVGPVIGREHPLGVTAEFWRRWAASHGLAVRLAAHQPPSEPIPCEMVALVAPPGAPDLEALDLGDGVVEAL